MKKFYGLSLLIIVMMCVGWVKSSAQNYRYEWGYDGDNINKSPWYGKTFDNSNPLTVNLTDPSQTFTAGSANANVLTVAYRGKKYSGGYKLNTSNQVTFSTSGQSVVTIAVYLRNDQKTDQAGAHYNIKDDGEIPYICIDAPKSNDNDNNRLYYTVAKSDIANGYKVITTTLNSGNHTLYAGNYEVAVFYIRVEQIINNTNSVRLDNTSFSTSLGLWKKYSTSNGMNLYLGGWKYQDASNVNNELINVLTRRSDHYYDPNYDPDYKYEQDPNKDPAKQVDDWDTPSTIYTFGEEDPYYTLGDGNGRIKQPTMGYYYYGESGTNYPYERYAYNSTDNGRNEYISNGYYGAYSFNPDNGDQGKEAKGDPFTVPCMGDFIKLEPECDGTIRLYLLQNATIDFNVEDYRKKAQDTDGYYEGGLLSNVAWRPVYIVDEAGTRFGEDDVIAETGTYITIGRGDTQAKVYDSNNQKGVLCLASDGTYTSDWTKWSQGSGGQITVTDANGTPRTGRYTTANYKDIVEKSTHVDFFKKVFKYENGELVLDNTLSLDNASADNAKENAANNGQYFVEVWPKLVDSEHFYNTYHNGAWQTRVWGPRYTGDGWLVISKGYVTYEFKVKAGKSYYIFSNNTKLGFCGYDFHPGAAPDKDTTLTLGDDGNATIITGSGRNQQTTTKSVEEFLSEEPKAYASVTLNRTFQEGWNAICLPFSVHEDQMRRWFGKNYGNYYNPTYKEDYELVTYNGVGRDKADGHLKAFFFHHVYQDIIAGYPYMLYIQNGAAAIGTNKVTFTNVTIEPNAQPLKEFTSSADYMPSELDLNTIAPETYFTFKGFYSPAEEAATVSQGDYYVLPSGLQLYNDTKESSMKGLRAVMHLNCDEYGAKQMVRIAGTNYSNIIDEMETQWKDATVINEIAEEMGLLPQPSNIYSLSGQLVRQNSVSLAGLPKGVYIVNGKKQLVK